MTPKEMRETFRLIYDPAAYRRVIGKKEVIIHCHHYNSRIQNTIEAATGIDGKGILSTSAEMVFAEQLSEVTKGISDEATRYALASALYAHLGYGQLDFSQIKKGVVTASASHFVAGWNAGFPERTAPACTFTEGFLQAAVYVVSGELVVAREEACMVSGQSQCKFAILGGRMSPIASIKRRPTMLNDALPARHANDFLRSANVDEDKILDALVGMPIYGDDQGLIPAFGVYLANIPADFYNLVFIRYMDEMAKKGLFRAAKKLLVFESESCVLNTFRGIMSSPEWDGLVAPMIKEDVDSLFGVVAISNGLGWGKWHVKQLVPRARLEMVSFNAYEAAGRLELCGAADTPQCTTLTGAGAGLMELIYGEGSPQERFGTYQSQEQECIVCGSPFCSFLIEKV